MATFPNSLKRRTSPDLRLGIKSSFNSFKPSVAALYVIYKAAGSSSSVQFTKEEWEFLRSKFLTSKLDEGSVARRKNK